MANIPVRPEDQALGSLCEIKTNNNDLLVVAILESIDETDNTRFNFVKADKDEKLPLLALDTPVKIITYSGNDGFMLLLGNVFVSSEELLSLVNVRSAQGYERRKYFRLNTSTTGIAVMQTENEDADKPFVVQLIDISLGGVSVSTVRMLKQNDVFLMTFNLMGTKLEFSCQVRREITDKRHPKDYKYGCEFINYSNRQLDQLCNILFKIQRLEIQKRRNRRYQ